MTSLTDTLFIHMRAVRAVTMTQDNRAQRSIADHRDIIAALESRRDARNDWCANIRWVWPRTSNGTATFSTGCPARTANGAANTHRENEHVHHISRCSTGANRGRTRSRVDRRVSSGHRRAEAERHQDDL